MFFGIFICSKIMDFDLMGPSGMIFRAMPCHYFSVPLFSVPGRAKIFRAKILRAVLCHKSAGRRVRAMPGHPWLVDWRFDLAMSIYSVETYVCLHSSTQRWR